MMTTNSDAATPAIPPAGERENPERAERGETSALVFRVEGVAIPQGSMKGYVQPNGRVAITSDNPKLKRWRRDVATAANVELYSRPPAQRALLKGAVHVDVVFVLPRPKSLPRGVVTHTTRPDLDKLLRAVLDALTGVTFSDDGQVASLIGRKRHTTSHEAPCAWVTVLAKDPQPLPLLEGLG